MVKIIVGILILLILFILFMHLENHHLTVTQYTVHARKLPKAFDGVKLVFISDLHNNTFGKDNEQLLRRIKNEKPDYIMIGGDMLIGKKDSDYTKTVAFIEELSREYRVYYVNGNHEQRLQECEYTKDTMYKDYHLSLKKAGVIFLHNQSVTLIKDNESIRVCGIEIPSEYYKKINRPKMSLQELNKCMNISKVDMFTILLAHNPMYFEEYVSWGADLVLSGHVHGGIMRLPFLGGVISPQYILFPQFDSGRFEKGEATMLLSRGLGVHTIKVRIGNRPELVCVTLKSD